MAKNTLFTHDAEEAILSIILRDPEFALRARDLRSFMFSSATHSRLFTEIVSFTERQLVPEPSLIVSSLEACGELGSIGGEGFVSYLLESDFSEENFTEYCNLVVSSYKTRSLIALGSGLSAKNVSTTNIDDTIYSLKGSLDRLTEVSGGDTTRHIGSSIKEVFGNILARLDNPGIRGSSWGIGSIDSVSGGKSEGDLWIIGGRPGQGKTAVVCNTILEDAKNGVPSLLIEKEMNQQTLTERFLAIELGIPLTNIRLGLLKQKEVDAIFTKLKEFKEYPIYIDTNFSPNISYLESAVRKYTSTKGVKVVYVDYLQLLVERDNNQTQELGRLSRMFKLLANDLKITVMLVSQLNRYVEMRDDKRPIMSDLRQSGNLEEDADFVVGLYRDEYYNRDSKDKGTMEFIILKNRNGPVGTLPLKFVNDTNKMSGAKS